MTQVMLTVAKDLRGQEKQDLLFNVRTHGAAVKWIQCLQSVQHRVPWKWGYTASAADLPRLEARITQTLLASDLTDSYLSEFIHNGELTVTQDVINATHRYVEDHQSQAAWHLQLHNDIHYWEGIRRGAANPSWKKIMWNPPGDYIEFDPADYELYDTEPCANFLMQDFAHVGRDPFNSFTFRDDQVLGSSCVIQHAVTSGFKWIKTDDHVNYVAHETQFRQWVRQNWHHFGSAGLIDEHDPRLCFGRMILADGADDYAQLSPDYKFVLKVTVHP